MEKMAPTDEVVMGVGKFAGLLPDIRWSEYDFDKVFAAGRDEFGDDKKKEVETNIKPAIATAG